MSLQLQSRILVILFTSVSAFAAGSKKVTTALCETAAVNDSSVHAGILMHGEHWVDLILAQGGAAGTRHLGAYREILNQLRDASLAGTAARVNEKVDGSPSLVAGFVNGEPFVAYKSHFNRKKNQVLISENSGNEGLNRSPALKKIIPEVFNILAPMMRKMDKKFHSLIFQGDLLFTPGDERLQVSEASVKIQANTLTYEIPSSHPLYATLAAAQLGIVFHTVGKQTVDADGMVGVEPFDNDLTVREFTQALSSTDIYAVDPWRENVPVAALSTEALNEIAQLEKQIVETMTALPESFRQAWSAKFLAKYRTYFNSGLRPPHDGGFYKSASDGRVETALWIEGFTQWLKGREEDALAADFEVFLKTDRAELEKLVLAYGAAVRIQALLWPAFHEATRSKLGGSDSEGLILKTEDTIVKLVDRLGFTLLNNQRWNRGGIQAPAAGFENLPVPFQKWEKAIFITMKAQPVHGGHIAMIREITRLYPDTPVYVIASDKTPNLEAAEWKKLGIAETKSGLAAREYTYIYESDFRKSLLEAGLKGTHAQVFVLNPGYFWSFLRTAQTQGVSGKVMLGVGDKEITEGRYDAQIAELGSVLELLPLPAQEGGISATQVRGAIKILALGEDGQTEAQALLERAFAYITDASQRREINAHLIERWRLVDEAAQKAVAPKKKAS